MNLDIIFLNQLYKKLDEKGIEYCVLRNASQIHNGDAHDIDMTIDFKQYHEVMTQIRNLASELGWKVHLMAVKDNGNLIAVHLYKIKFGRPILLHFDFFKAFGWKGYQLLSYQQMLQDRIRISGIYEASKPVQAVTMLFSRYLYHGYIKENYRDFIQQVYLVEKSSVTNLMSQFLGKELVDMIYNMVILGQWEFIEQEYNTVRKEVNRRLEIKQKNVNFKMKMFSLKRIIKHTGIVVQLPKQQMTESYREYIREIQKLLSRTFSNDEVINKFSSENEAEIKFLNYIKFSIALSQGKLIFTDNSTKFTGFANVLVEDISKRSAEETACQILERMSRRYMK